MKDKKKLEESRRRLKLSMEAFGKQRKREKEDLAFQVPEMQWTTEAASARQGQQAAGGLPAIPPRPMLSISQVDQPCQLVMSQIRSAHLGINIHPMSEDASKETAEVIQDILRKIDEDSRADQARYWAADRASKCGWGVYRVNSRYVDRRDKPMEKGPDGKLLLTAEDFDQVLTVERILRQEYAHFDPAANKPDFSDGEWAFLESWMSFDDFKRDYPDADTALFDDEQLGSEYAAEAPGWTELTQDGRRSIRVVEYFYKQHEIETACLLSDGSVVLKSERAAGVKYAQEIVAERDFDTVTVLWCKHTATEVLEDGDWDSPYIPLIPVIGKELIPFEGERRWTGIIGPAKDGQRFYNVSASTVVENMLLEPKTPFVGDPKQFEGFEGWWAQANARAFPYLPANMIVGGQVLPPPARVPKDTTGMSLAMLGLQESKMFVQSVTGIYDPGLGELAARKQGQQQPSGKAILALQGQSDAGNSHYLRNLAEISMPYEALVKLSKIAKIYDRAGRVQRLKDSEDNPRTVMLNAPFYMDKQGAPVRYEQNKWDGQPPQGLKTFDLRHGVYSVTVTIGKSYQSRLQQGAEELGVLLQAMPPELQLLLLPTYLKFRDTPGAPEMAKIVKRFRDQKFPGVDREQGEQPSPEQLESENQALKAQLQEAQKILQQMQQEIQIDQAKQQSTIVKAAKDNETKERIEGAKLAQQAELERAKLDNQVVLQEMKNTIELMKLQITGLQAQQQQSGQQRHELGLARATAGSAAIEQAATQEHESGEAALARDFESRETARGREFESDEAQRERDAAAEQAEADRQAAAAQAAQQDGGDV